MKVTLQPIEYLFPGGEGAWYRSGFAITLDHFKLTKAKKRHPCTMPRCSEKKPHNVKNSEYSVWVALFAQNFISRLFIAIPLVSAFVDERFRKQEENPPFLEN